MTIEPRPRTAIRGRPVATDGPLECARCARHMRKAATIWPEGAICNSCYYAATSAHGQCPGCGAERLLPGRLAVADTPVCRDCAGIRQDFLCRGCNTEQRPYRRGHCARCALRSDLAQDYLHDKVPDGFRTLLDALCRVERPESILTWKRSAKVQALLSGFATGAIPLTHDGLDGFTPAGAHVEHMRAILVHHGVLPARDMSLALFTAWIDDKLRVVANPQITRPVRRFATWHHRRRISELAAAGRSTRGAIHASKQEITEVLKFLTWLDAEHSRVLGTCTQQDIDQWIATGTTTRHAIRTFLVWSAKTRITAGISLGHRQPRTVRILTQDQRLAWIRELLTGDGDSLAYRVAGLLLLLYAQPLVRIAELPLSAVLTGPEGLSLRLGTTPAPVPEPFDALVLRHIAHRPHLRTAGTGSPWLFPGLRPGRHLLPGTLTSRLLTLGIDVLGARNAALRDLASQVPPTVAADILGYSAPVMHRHAQLAAQPWHRYAAKA